MSGLLAAAPVTLFSSLMSRREQWSCDTWRGGNVYLFTCFCNIAIFSINLKRLHLNRALNYLQGNLEAMVCTRLFKWTVNEGSQSMQFSCPCVSIWLKCLCLVAIFFTSVEHALTWWQLRLRMTNQWPVMEGALLRYHWQRKIDRSKWPLKCDARFHVTIAHCILLFLALSCNCTD